MFHGPRNPTRPPLARPPTNPARSAQVLDRFVSAVDSAPGAVAIHCDGRRGHAYTLLTAYMLRRRLFPSGGEAVAWLHMAHASDAPVAVECALLDAARRRARSLSLCLEADLAPLTGAAAAGRRGSDSAAAGSPFPCGPRSPGRGRCARAFSVSSPNVVVVVDAADAAGDLGPSAAALAHAKVQRGNQT